MNSNDYVQKSLILALMLGVTAPSPAQTGAEVQTAAPIASGPPLWKVSKDDHTLWIFALLTPLDTGLNWQSPQVAAVIAEAEEYIFIKAPEPKIPVNPLKLINGLRLVMKIRNIPDGRNQAMSNYRVWLSATARARIAGETTSSPFI